MLTLNKSRRPIRGFAVITLLLGTVALMGVIASMVAITRSNLTRANDVARPYASAIILQANNLTLAFQQMQARGFAPASISYISETGANDMLNPQNISLSPQVPPAQAFDPAASTKFWTWKSSTTASVTGGPVIKFPGVGVGTNADYAFILADLDETVCEEINRYLTDATTIQPSGKSLAAWTGSTPAKSEGTALDLQSGAAGLTGLMQACVSTTEAGANPPRYVFYSVAEPQ